MSGVCPNKAHPILHTYGGARGWWRESTNTKRESASALLFSAVSSLTHTKQKQTRVVFFHNTHMQLAHPGRLVLHPKFLKVGAAHLAFSRPSGWRHLVSPASSARAAGHPYFRFSTQDREARRRCQGDRRRASPLHERGDACLMSVPT